MHTTTIVKKEIVDKWAPVLENDKFPAINGAERRAVTAQILENTQTCIQNGEIETINRVMQGSPIQESMAQLNEAAPANNTSGVSNYDPILISLIRRAAPNLIAYDILGVQPMTGPSGQVFAMRSRYTDQANTEAFYNEANTGHSTVVGGNTEIVGDSSGNLGTTPTGNSETWNYAGGMSLAQAEALGTSGNTAWPEMTISLEKVSVNAKSRKLKAEYSTEFAQDLKAIHGLEAETELANVLGTELIAEINREVVRMIYLCAVTGSQTNVNTVGTFNLDTDSNGRWMGEKFAGLHMHLELESNIIAKQTRRGKGNILLCSSNVASALVMAGILKFNEAAANLTVDDTGVTYAGNIGRMKVYIDPYATVDYIVPGYKGQNSWDAGVFYCPYTPLQMVRAVSENAFQPKIGFQTRYGMIANPFSKGGVASDGSLEQNANVYYRRSLITNLM